jgi:hypothetical protein
VKAEILQPLRNSHPLFTLFVVAAADFFFSGAYFHPRFQRANRLLCRHIVRIKAEPTTNNKNSSGANRSSKKRKCSGSDDTGKTSKSNDTRKKNAAGTDTDKTKRPFPDGKVQPCFTSSSSSSSSAPGATTVGSVLSSMMDDRSILGLGPHLSNCNNQPQLLHDCADSTTHEVGHINNHRSRPLRDGFERNQTPSADSTIAATAPTRMMMSHDKINFDELRRTVHHRNGVRGSFSNGLLGFSDEIISLFCFDDSGGCSSTSTSSGNSSG